MARRAFRRRCVLDDARYLHAARAELLWRLERHDEAVVAHGRALDLGPDDAERRWMEQRRPELAPGPLS